MKLHVLSTVLFFAAVAIVAGCDVQKSPGPIAPATVTPTETSAPSASPSHCDAGDPETIIRCERARYGHMEPGEVIEFLKRSADSLNRNEITGGPFGVLRKPTGTQCEGYACDIICAGQGTAQQQHDVLRDADGAQEPVWGEADGYPHIRVDVCDIR
jgi:hypothetical protein